MSANMQSFNPLIKQYANFYHNKSEIGDCYNIFSGEGPWFYAKVIQDQKFPSSRAVELMFTRWPSEDDAIGIAETFEKNFNIPVTKLEISIERDLLENTFIKRDYISIFQTNISQNVKDGMKIRGTSVEFV